MTWGFIWLMFMLKIPMVGLGCIIWWAVRSTDEPRQEEPAKATPRVQPHRPRPRRPPRLRPRGPHGDPAVLPSPPRVRPVTAVAARRHRSGR